MAIPTLLARLTWNRDGWRQPSGFIPRSEIGTYVGSHGYGHEEWLNRSEWTLNGWRYGYIEGVSRAGEKLRGQTIDLLLFAVKPTKQRVVVGYISPAEVITEQQAQVAHDEFRKRKWLNGMIAEVRERTGDAKKFARDIQHPFSVANIRWKPNSARFVSTGVPVRSSDRIVSSSRYRLRQADSSYFANWKKRISKFTENVLPEDGLSAYEGEITVQLVRHRKREAALRAAKLESVRAKSADGRLRCEVPGCGFDFEEVYGPCGAGYAQVHHLQPLGLLSKSVKTTLDQLAVVCANCHAMIHYKGKCRPLKGLIL